MDTIKITGFVDGEMKTLEFPILPTPLAKLVEVLPLVTGAMDTEAAVNAVTKALFYGIRRAKGEITLEWLQDNIDFHNSESVFLTFAKVNAMNVGVAKPGEAPAGQS